MTFHVRSRKYLLDGLEATPYTLREMLHDVTEDDRRWDFTQDTERFTLRAIVAHLAAWEPVFHGWIAQARDEDEPTLVSVDEEELEHKWDFEHSNPLTNLGLYSDSRAALVTSLHEMSPDAFERLAGRGHSPPISIGMQAVIILGHDGYHLRQVAEWLAASRRS